MAKIPIRVRQRTKPIVNVLEQPFDVDDPVLEEMFDAVEGLRRKLEGMSLAAKKRTIGLELGRQVAYQLCNEHGAVNIDQVHAVLYQRYGIPTLGMAAGSVFRGKLWHKLVGQDTPTTRASSHSRPIPTWTFSEWQE